MGKMALYKFIAITDAKFPENRAMIPNRGKYFFTS